MDNLQRPLEAVDEELVPAWDPDVPTRLMGERAAAGVGFGCESRGFAPDKQPLSDDLARRAVTQAELVVRLSLLAQAGERLSSSLDYEATLENAGSLPAPTLADLCLLEVAEGDMVRRSAHAPAARALEEMIGAAGFACSARGKLDGRALFPTASGLYPEVDDRFLQEVATSPEHLALLRSLGIRSLLRVPLETRGEPIGALTLCFTSSGRRHSASDRDLAEELARRVATAIENARLYRASQEAARLAEQQNQTKDAFLGVVSHELRTPLNAILGWSQILRRNKVVEPAVLEKGLSIIDRNARAQMKLLEDLLDVSRIISGKLRLDLKRVDLGAVVRAAIEAIRPAAEAKGVELLELVEPCVFVSGDPERLQQIVWNLLSNAVKFTPQDGFVEAQLEHRDGAVHISVRDSGRGIEADFAPHVFERFRQADTSTTRRTGGLGLGLSIVQHLVELHGGSVEVHSDGLERGSTFTVKLPLRAESILDAEAAARDGLDADANVSVVRLDGLKVLVVDDEPDARDMATTLLKVAGAEIEVASSSAEAIARLATFAADVLVSDVGMPGEDGYALLAKIRASGAPYARIPALALTAYASPDDARRAVMAGFHAHLPKPAEPAVLSALIANLSGRSPHEMM